MNATFKIQTTDTVTEDARLFIEISQQCISFAVIDNGNECVALQCYQYNNETDVDTTAEKLKHIASEEDLLQEDFKKTTVIYSYPTSAIVPAEFANQETNRQMLEMLYGDLGDVFIRTDFMYAHGMHNVFTVPKQIDAVVSYLFSSPVSTHLYSLLPDMFSTYGNQLHTIFGTSSFTAMLIKDGRLQLVQNYQFKTPEDVAFYLLQICESFEVDLNEINLHLNGMVDRSSFLFTEINRYFLQISFATLPGKFIYPEEMGDFPVHYFSHLFAAASCV